MSLCCSADLESYWGWTVVSVTGISTTGVEQIGGSLIAELSQSGSVAVSHSKMFNQI